MPSRAAADYADSVEPIVRKTAAWAWRLLVILAALIALLWVIERLEIIVVPLLLALMLSALLVPAVDWLDRRGAPRGGAVALVLLAGFAVLGGIMTFVISQFIVGLPDLVNQVTRSIDSAKKWLIEGPLHLSRQQIDQRRQRGDPGAAEQSGEVDQRRPVDRGHRHRNRHGRTADVVHADLLPLRRSQHLALRHKIFPADVRDRVRDAGRAGFGSLIGYVRATFLVALVDAAGSRHRFGDHERAAGSATGLAGVSRCLHPAGRCRHQRLSRGGGGAAGEGLCLRADHSRPASSA